MAAVRLHQNQRLADIADMANELRHLLLLVFRAPEAQGRNGGPFAVAAQIALTIVERQSECLNVARDNQEADDNAS